MPKSLIKLFFLLVFASEASAWVRAAGGNVGLKVASQASAFSSGNGDPALFALNAFVVFITAIFAYPKLKTITGMLLDERALLLIYMYSFLSVLWAENIGNSIRIAIYLLFGLVQFTYLGWFLDAEEQIVTIGQIVTLFAVLSVAGQFLLSSSGDPAPGWTGIFPSKNYLGNVMAIGIITLLLESGRWTVARVLKMGICLPILVLSQSFTAIVCALACGGVIAYLKLTRRQKLVLVGAGVSLGVWISVLLPNFAALLLGASGKDTTLTGRDVIWAFAFKYIALRPFFGYGYYGFWISQQDAALEYLGWNPNQAHNGFIDLTLNEGFVGLAILLLVFYVALRRSLRQLRQGDATGAGRWSFVMLVYLLVHNVSEADFYQRPAWVVFLVAFIASAKADLPVRYERQEDLPENAAEGAFSESPPQPALA